MYILVNHTINMPAEFWGAAQKYLTTLPEGGVKRIVSIFPSDNMDQCTTIWEAESTESLDRYLQNKIGKAGILNNSEMGIALRGINTLWR